MSLGDNVLSIAMVVKQGSRDHQGSLSGSQKVSKKEGIDYFNFYNILWKEKDDLRLY